MMQGNESIEQVTLDHVADLKISRDLGFNELVSLQSLRIGLSMLAVTVWQFEAPIRKQEDQDNVQITFFGHRPDTDRRLTLLLPCYFHWFGVSLCNFVRLVGFLASLQSGHITRNDLSTAQGRKRVGSACREYVESVAEVRNVVVWRNKVAAHFAITDPREEDNLATLDMSVMHPVAFSSSRYRVGAFALSYGSGGEVSIESQIPAWSVTEIYEQLAARYWPEFRWP